MVTIQKSKPLPLLQYLLIRIVPLTLLILVVASILALTMTSRISSEKAFELLQEQQKQTMRIIGLRLENIHSQAVSLSKNELLINGLIDFEGRNNYLPAFFRSLKLAGYEAADVAMTDYKGRILFSNSEKMEPLHSTAKNVIKQGQSFISFDDSSLILTKPILYLGQAEGALVVVLKQEALSQVFDVGFQYNGTIVSNSDRVILYSSIPEFGTEDSIFMVYEDKELLEIHEKLNDGSGLEISTLQFKETALASQNWIKNFLISGVAILIIVLCGSIFLVVYIARRDVSHLSSVVKEIQGANDIYKRVEPSGPEELYSLGHEFNRMLETIQRTTTSYEYVDGIISSTAEGIITINPKGIIETYNKASEIMFGYNEAEAIGQNISILLPEGERKAHDKYVQDSQMYIPRIINKTRDLQGCRKDGSLFPLELNVAPMSIAGEKKFIGICRDITERKAIEKMKSEFVSTVSHELRTPLTSIKGSIGLIEGGALGKLPDSANDMMHIAYKNTERLINLVNDILDMEKLDSGSMEFCFTENDMSQVLKQVIDINQGYATEHNVTFELKKNLPETLVNIDVHRVTQVITNLLSNAAKFSPEHGNVEIFTEIREGCVRTCIKDHGPGIPDDFKTSIFGKFAQADSSDDREKGGTGLGLNISKSIIDNHDGNIDFETKLGVGTTFYFDLPLIVSEEERKVSKENIVSGSKKILICDSDMNTAKNITDMIPNDNIRIDIAKNAFEAKEMMAKEKYEVVFIEFSLPDQDGISLISELREDKSNRDIPLIVISSNVEENWRESAELNAGVVDWLEKPVRKEQLLSSLNSVLKFNLNLKTKPTVLYVEDDDDLIKITKATLDDMVSFDAVGTLQDAKVRIKSKDYDLIILDIGLPDGSGLDLMSEIKLSGKSLTPVIIMSGEEMNQNVVAQVEAVFLKSRMSNDALVETVRKLVLS